ncbi:MAG: adenylate kinase [Dehalococcoidia bacterium]|nr:adenylate kinase [Dehalococcoidia bacterium]
MWYVVLLGAPGAGKGTQAGPLARRLGVLHLTSGDLFRDNISKGTELGALAKGYMDRGELVPDDITVRMVLDRLEQPDAANGAILDGFPRTVTQAQALDDALAAKGAQVNKVIYLQVNDDELLARLSGRWLCRACGASYHLRFNPPKRDGVCDTCGGALYQRSDDTRETALRRLDVFHQQTKALIPYYADQHKLEIVDGAGPIDEVAGQLARAAQPPQPLN